MSTEPSVNSHPPVIKSKPNKSRHRRLTSGDGQETDGPLIDTTATLTLRSKRTARKSKKRASRLAENGLLDLPIEILIDIFAYLQPRDIAILKQINHIAQAIVIQNHDYIVSSIIKRRYAVLARCFPIPRLLEDVNERYYESLLSPEHQRMLIIHKKPYQHIATPVESVICSCLTCVLAWNNLCLVIDLAHWQDFLDRREPIPQFARGAALKEEWNIDLLHRQTELVLAACHDFLVYAHLLDMHLQTTIRTLRRPVKAGHPRPYENTQEDLSSGNDQFLERKGPSSYEFPFHRDIYYSLECYVPNRRWDREEKRWLYPGGDQHDFDLEWIKRRVEAIEAAKPLIGQSSLGRST